MLDSSLHSTTKYIIWLTKTCNRKGPSYLAELLWVPGCRSIVGGEPVRAHAKDILVDEIRSLLRYLRTGRPVHLEARRLLRRSADLRAGSSRLMSGRSGGLDGDVDVEVDTNRLVLEVGGGWSGEGLEAAEAAAAPAAVQGRGWQASAVTVMVPVPCECTSPGRCGPQQQRESAPPDWQVAMDVITERPRGHAYVDFVNQEASCLGLPADLVSSRLLSSTGTLTCTPIDSAKLRAETSP